MKLVYESATNIPWVFAYTAQNADIVYQKNKNNINVEE